jgi:hypothetical protein
LLSAVAAQHNNVVRVAHDAGTQSLL